MELNKIIIGIVIALLVYVSIKIRLSMHKKAKEHAEAVHRQVVQASKKAEQAEAGRRTHEEKLRISTGGNSATDTVGNILKRGVDRGRSE